MHPFKIEPFTPIGGGYSKEQWLRDCMEAEMRRLRVLDPTIKFADMDDEDALSNWEKENLGET